MGKFIDGAYALWKNPDEAWESRNGGKSKKEFLLSMAGYREEGGHQLDVLSGKVTGEYEDDPDKANTLLTLFDTLSKNWKRVEEATEITSIDEFLAQLKFIVNRVEPSENLLEVLNPFRDVGQSKLTLDQIYSVKGELIDTVSLDAAGRVEALKVAEYVSDQSVFVFSSMASSTLFLQKQGEGDAFVNEVYGPVMDLVRRKKFTAPSIVAGKANFSKRLESLTLSFRNMKLKAKLVETIMFEKQRILVGEIEGQDGFRVFCVS